MFYTQKTTQFVFKTNNNSLETPKNIKSYLVLSQFFICFLSVDFVYNFVTLLLLSLNECLIQKKRESPIIPNNKCHNSDY
jgi:hypothetical protein